MDKTLRRFPIERLDEELDWSPCFQVAFQHDMSASVYYDINYFDKYKNYENKPIARRINTFRTRITEKYCRSLLDVGIGSGEFIKRSRIRCLGYDINEAGVAWLKERGLYANPYESFPGVEGVSMWDTLEHIPDPTDLLARIPPRRFLFLSLPIFDDLRDIRKSKHYRPDEHFYYWSRDGLRKFLNHLGFVFLEWSDEETRAGRQSIESFVFRRVSHDERHEILQGGREPGGG